MKLKHVVAVLAVALTASAAVAGTNYVTNGDFSQGLTGWSTNSNAYFIGSNTYYEGAIGFDAHLRQTVLGATGAATLQLDVGLTSGWYEYVLWNGVNVSGTLTDSNHYSFNVTATGTDSLDIVGLSLIHI